VPRRALTPESNLSAAAAMGRWRGTTTVMIGRKIRPDGSRKRRQGSHDGACDSGKTPRHATCSIGGCHGRSSPLADAPVHDVHRLRSLLIASKPWGSVRRGRSPHAGCLTLRVPRVHEPPVLPRRKDGGGVRALAMRFYEPVGGTRLRVAGAGTADASDSNEKWTRLLDGSRREFFEKRPGNLNHLLASRYAWMNAYVAGKRGVVELGSGAGLCREFVTNPNLKLTDFIKHPWVDDAVDALRTPFDSASLDSVICCHMLHHLANPMAFFREMRRILRPGGYLLIQELNSSIAMLALNRLMRHEGWNYAVDVFDERAVVNNPRDPSSPNIAVPELLFSDTGRFERRVEGFRVDRNELCEFFSFALSGGVNAKTRTINMGPSILSGMDRIDRALIRLLPSIFALGRCVALERI